MISRSAVTIVMLILAVFNEVAVAENSIYIFGAFGDTDTDVAFDGLNRVADDKSSYSLGAGYELTRNISVEGAYLDAGSHRGETECPPNLSWDVEYDDLSSAFDARGEDLLYGAGLRWSVDEHWKVFAEYGKVEFDLDSTSIGVRYQF